MDREERRRYITLRSCVVAESLNLTESLSDWHSQKKFIQRVEGNKLHSSIQRNHQTHFRRGEGGKMGRWVYRSTTPSTVQLSTDGNLNFYLSTLRFKSESTDKLSKANLQLTKTWQPKQHTKEWVNLNSVPLSPPSISWSTSFTSSPLES